VVLAPSVASAFIISTTAFAQYPASPPAPTSPEAQAKIDIVAKKLCKDEPVVGTRLAVRHKCDTPAQLVQCQRQAREMIEDFRRRPCMAGAESGENQPMPW
jgi:hypothetical protein